MAISNLIVRFYFVAKKRSRRISRGDFEERRGAAAFIAGYFRGTNADDDETCENDCDETLTTLTTVNTTRKK